MIHIKTVYEKKSECTGCRACEKNCPKKAIKMETDFKGYLYPVIDENKCINCKICLNSCPVKKRKIKLKKPVCYAVKHKLDKERENSSSGGFFIELARWAINKKGIVCGVKFNNSFQVEHSMASSEKEIMKFRGSKYIQSNTNDIFNTVKSHLKDRKTVLFSGTPCQIAGLKSFLKVEYDNLITVDNICHGVGSPKIFEEYKNKMEKRKKSKLKSISFRHKNSNGDHNLKITFENNKTKVYLPYEDEFYKMFTDDLCLRDSCLDCKFANTDRISDITMGDFWGIERILPSFKDEKGTSIILINTEEGEKIFEQIKDKFVYEKVDLEKCLQQNLKSPTLKKDNYDKYWEEYKKNGYNFIAKKYGKLSTKEKIKRIVKRNIRKIKKWIEKKN